MSVSRSNGRWAWSGVVDIYYFCPPRTYSPLFWYHLNLSLGNSFLSSIYRIGLGPILSPASGGLWPRLGQSGCFVVFSNCDCNKELAQDPELANESHLWKCFPAKIDSCKNANLGAIGNHQEESSCLRIKPTHGKQRERKKQTERRWKWMSFFKRTWLHSCLNEI